MSAPKSILLTLRNDYQKEFVITDKMGLCANISALDGSLENVADKRLYPFEGKQVTGESVEIETSTEPFAQFVLADGTKVKIKSVMLEAVRLDAHNDQGEPVYQFQVQQIIGVVAPDNLKRKPQ